MARNVAFEALVARANGGNAAVAPVTRAPFRIIPLPVTAFAETWASRPTEAQQAGLRLVGSSVVESARAEAAKRAWQMHPAEGDDGNRVDCFNDALMRGVLAEALTKSHDRDQTFFDLAPDTIQIALTTETIGRLWDEFAQLITELSPLEPEASDDDLVELAAMLATGEAWSHMSSIEARGVKRLLRQCVERMRPPPNDES